MALLLSDVAKEIRGWPKDFIDIEPGVRRFKLNSDPGKKIRRIVFEFESPVELAEYADLRFLLGGALKQDLQCDLLAGDKGFPEIRFTTTDGAVFRFKRGNMKDFFDTLRSEERQEVSLALRYFIHDTDTKNNPAAQLPFPQSAVRLVAFDFLPHPDRDSNIDFGSVALVRNAIKAEPEVGSGLISITGVYPHHKISPFYTDNGKISICVTTNFDQRLLDGTARLWLKAFNLENTLVFAEDSVVKIGKAYHQIIFPTRGPYRLVAAVVDHKSGVIGRWETKCGFGTRSDEVRAGIMGISDSGFEDEIGTMGGRYQRRVISPARFGDATKFGTTWTNGMKPIPTCAPIPKQDFIISLKAMPSWLSNRKGAHDSYRYAPSNWEVYAKGIRFLVTEMKASDFRFLETWNEASVIHEWADSLESLIKLHQITYDTAKSVWPEIVVLGGTTHTFDHKFIARFIESGGVNYCDGLAIHGYTYQPERLREDLWSVRTALDSKGFHDKGIYMTEIGFRTPAFTEMDQARHLVRATLHASAIPHFKSILWFRLENATAELGGGYDQNASTGYAAIGHKKAFVRPMAVAYRFLARFLDFFGQSNISSEDNQDIFSFKTVHGNVLITDGFTAEDRESRCTVADGCVAYDMFGGPVLIEAGTAKSKYGPVFVVPVKLEQALFEL